jgi:hypothetical protein
LIDQRHDREQYPCCTAAFMNDLECTWYAILGWISKIMAKNSLINLQIGMRLRIAWGERATYLASMVATTHGSNLSLHLGYQEERAALFVQQPQHIQYGTWPKWIFIIFHSKETSKIGVDITIYLLFVGFNMILLSPMVLCAVAESSSLMNGIISNVWQGICGQVHQHADAWLVQV